ncbi:MAG: 16S rRNA (guanine(527)-N(7))-methyltransferase RsmG [bacterium]|nr:16S rRNA (guanine(527)-N(7))-methyltransferase RsmG [bacterium]
MSTADPAAFGEALIQALPAEAPIPDSVQLAEMFRYYQAVVEANLSFNLTRVVDPVEAAVKHFADSIALLGWVAGANVRVARVLDVGTGAGFPAVPLAIMHPQGNVTAIDSTAKKVDFVAETCTRLGLGNIRAEQRRAEEWRCAARFDLVTCKAIGPIDRCVDYVKGLVRRGGYLVVYKTPGMSAEERDAGGRAAQQHSFEVVKPYAYELRMGDDRLARLLWILRKL